MVPVFLDGARIGHFQVDILPSQRELIFRKVDFVEFGPRIHTSLATISDPVTEIRIPLVKFNIRLAEKDIFDLNTTEIQKILHAKGAPIYSSNIEQIKHYHTHDMTYSWRVANVTIDQLEEFFDIDQYVPE